GAHVRGELFAGSPELREGDALCGHTTLEEVHLRAHLTGDHRRRGFEVVALEQRLHQATSGLDLGLLTILLEQLSLELISQLGDRLGLAGVPGKIVVERRYELLFDLAQAELEHDLTPLELFAKVVLWRR